MTPLVAVLMLVAGEKPDPLPASKSFDTLTFSFSTGQPFGPAGTLSLTAEGKASYFHQTAPATGSGGRITKANWDTPKAEMAALFGKLLEAGLLDLPEGSGVGGFTGRASFRVTSGRWFATVEAHPVPEKILEHLRPLLQKAHPGSWPAPVKQPADEKPTLTELRYTFTEKVQGPEATLTVNRTGQVTYLRRTHPTEPGGSKRLVDKGWVIPKVDAEKLLDGILADGLFDLEDTNGQVFPNHYVLAHSGRWRAITRPKTLSERVMKHLRPLLEKADPEVWKKP